LNVCAIVATHAGRFLSPGHPLGSVVLIVSRLLVRHLPEADYIVALSPDGTIAEKGAFAELMAAPSTSTPNDSGGSGQSSGGYVRTLMTNREDLRAADHDADEQNDGNGAGLETKPVEAIILAAETAAEEDGAGVISDWRIYVYYARALGWLVLSAFLAFTWISSGISATQRRSPLEMALVWKPL